METAVENTICTAIELRQVISFSYGGVSRLAEPYCYGRLADRTEALLCYQTGGYARYSAVAGWKLFRVDEMSYLEIADRTFDDVREEPDREYDSRRSAFAGIICELPRLAPDEGRASVADRPGGAVTLVERHAYPGRRNAVSLLGDHFIKMKRFRLFHVIPWFKWFRAG